MASGRFSIRVPKQLHEELIRQAADEGVSLNLYLNLLLTAGVVQGRVIEKVWDPRVTITHIEERVRIVEPTE